MKLIAITILIPLIFLQYSCKSNLTNEYNVGQHKLLIEKPNSFEEMSIDNVNKFMEDGIQLFKQSGYTGYSDQKSIFFFQKGEFSLLKAKKYGLEQHMIDDYKGQWKNMKGILFDVLKKKTNEMEGATIDSVSRIEKINGIDFYVFETNIYLRDLNNTKTNLKSLRYSTVVDNQDLVVDASFINQNDSIDINKSIRSIKIVE